MENSIIGSVKEWLYDPTVGKIVFIIAGIIIIKAITHTAQRILLKRIESIDTRYYSGK